METKNFGKLSTGESANLYIFNRKNYSISVTDYGALLVNVIVRDKNGVDTDIVLGYDDVSGYETYNNWFGANVGRVANRIAGAEFTINDVKYNLYKNEGNNNLHSCPNPYCKRMWSVKNITDNSITFYLNSPHMDQGYPGNMDIYITYNLLDDSSFEIKYEACADADTIINMTNHSYFNLNGEGNGDILDHSLKIYADKYTPTDIYQIPTGEICDVSDTPMDFRVLKRIGEHIDTEYEQLKIGNGYDHNYITGKKGEGIHPIIQVIGDKSGISMNIESDYPGVQVYTGNFMGDREGTKSQPGKGKHRYKFRDAVCFEPQTFPNAINIPEFNTCDFESPILKMGEKYEHRIIYRFRTLS